MLDKLGTEAKGLVNSPFVALRELYTLLMATSSVEAEQEQSDQDKYKILLDKDGNATLNFKNPEVQEEIEMHIHKLSKRCTREVEGG